MGINTGALKRITLLSLMITIMLTSVIPEINTAEAANKKTIKINKIVKAAKKMKGKSITSFPKSFHKGRWCADFVHWAAKKAKLTNNKIFPKKAKGVSALISWYKKKGQYHKNTKKFKPKKGDLVFLSSSSHVGIVAKVTKSYVYLIHGNWSNRVKYTKLKKHGYTKSQKAKIKGYARPKY